MNAPLRLGIVGCGGISHQHGKAAAVIPDMLRFVACCDVRREVAESWAAEYGAERAYTDYEEMLRREALDGVLLATWPSQHREQIERCLLAGARNILCEKSLALTGREALEIGEMVTAAGAFVMEGFMYRHHPALRQLDALLSAGEIGAVDNVRAVFDAFDPETAPADDPHRDWRQRVDCGGGVPFDYTCYAVNACGHLIRHLPLRVSAVGSVSEKYGTIDRLYGLIEYAGGGVGLIESSKRADQNQELQVSGSRGRLTIPVAWTLPGVVTIQKLYGKRWSEWGTEEYRVLEANSYQLQLKNFAQVVRGEAQPVVPLAQSVVNVFVLEALVTSMREKRVVEIRVPEASRRAAAEVWR